VERSADRSLKCPVPLDTHTQAPLRLPDLSTSVSQVAKGRSSAASGRAASEVPQCPGLPGSSFAALPRAQASQQNEPLRLSLPCPAPLGTRPLRSLVPSASSLPPLNSSSTPSRGGAQRSGSVALSPLDLPPLALNECHFVLSQAHAMVDLRISADCSGLHWQRSGSLRSADPWSRLRLLGMKPRLCLCIWG